MGNSPKFPGKYYAPGAKPSPGIRIKDDLLFNTGVITNVDPDRWMVDIELFDRKGLLSGIKLTQSYAGTSSYMAAMPDRGTIVIVATTAKHKWILAYLPNYLLALDGESVQKWPDELNPSDINVYHYRFRKLLPGQLALGSGEGCELFLGNDINMETGMGNGLQMRQFEKNNILTGINNSVFSSGVWCNAGAVLRNSPSSSKLKEEGFFSDPIILPNKRIIREYKPYGNEQYDGYLSEYHLEVEDVGSSALPVNDINGESNTTARNPIAIFSLGNYVGNDDRFPDTYGKALGVNLFKDPDDQDGLFKFIPLPHNLFSGIGIAAALFKPDKRDKDQGAFFGIDKEGHFYHYLPAATGGGIGNGRSLSVLARGNRKEIWGKDNSLGNSWDYKAEGGIRWDIGSHDSGDNNPHKGRSFDIKTSSSVFFMFGSAATNKVMQFDAKKKEIEDLSGYKKIEKVAGNERKEIDNTRETIIKGNERLQIQGMKQQTIGAGYSTNVGVNMTLSVGSVYSESVTKEKRESFGSRVTNVTSGSIETNVTLGNITEKIKAGSRSTDIKAGFIKNNVEAGSILNTIKAGMFSATTDQGIITFKTKQGNYILSTNNGVGIFSANLGINIKTNKAATTNITSGSVNLIGKTMTTGGVVTTLTHKDYITGAPLVGSTTVMASL